MVTTTQAKEYFGLVHGDDSRAKYLKIRAEIRHICQELDVVNQQSDRWNDALVRVVDQVSFFSTRKTYRQAWNNRQATQEGLDFLAALKALVGDSAANYGDYLRQNMEEPVGDEPPSQWVTDCYHLTDTEDSCVGFHTSFVCFITLI